MISQTPHLPLRFYSWPQQAQESQLIPLSWHPSSHCPSGQRTPHLECPTTTCYSSDIYLLFMAADGPSLIYWNGMVGFSGKNSCCMQSTTVAPLPCTILTWDNGNPQAEEGTPL
ncbi:hypothetical protein M404DRAFT_133145 [Pisolithus tinctorius Marx 270]|uniref:Uncharacterized protein n=1 Tax=Pisolithus tinctorius Marx 270 TaxID=870435 RepID=A0A0C3P644_PISTI|nr:hypothetical protein M404DRAFT_133145 [Pisolithus tinctorius Marx 270]